MRTLALVSILVVVVPGALVACGGEAANDGTAGGEPMDTCDRSDCAGLQPPEITAIDPRSCVEPSCAAAIDGAIRVRFTEPIDPLTADGGHADCTGNLVVWQEGFDPSMGGPCVEGTITVSTVEVALTPSVPLLPATAYQAYVGQGILDLSGMGLTAPFQWRFTTQAPPACGNGEQTVDEACDDGNALDGDYCSADCHLATGECGDAVVQAAVETCDDGNSESGDGCSVRCSLEVREPLVLPGVGASCGLRRDGSVRCWGGPLDDAPEGVFGDLAVGAGFACAVGQAAGPGVERPLTCWGDAVGAPASLALEGIVAAGDQLCGLTSGGGVECHGIGAGAQARALPGAGYTQLTLGDGVVCALDAEGAATCVGDFQLPLTGVRGLSALAVGDGFACGIDAAGAPLCFGGGEGSRGLEGPPPGPFVAIAAGGQVVCAQKASGELVCWHETGGAGPSPGTRLMASFALGPEHGCGVTMSDQALCWGDTGASALQIPTDFP